VPDTVVSPITSAAIAAPSALAVPAAPAAVPALAQAAPLARGTSEMVPALLRRGDALLRQGDVVAARLFYERAAAAGSGPGATGAGKTYDPGFLGSIDAFGLRGDAARASAWYQKGVALGDKEAGERLKELAAPAGR
jgi:TPR repeat protein